jgi:hypothetical protein
MNQNELHKKLILAARAHPPADTVPYRFEARIMAHLVHGPRLDQWAIWATALWRAAVPCLALTLLLGAWTLMSSHDPASTESLSSAMDNAVYAAVDYPGDVW